MEIIKKFLLFIKNLFKKDKIKEIEPPKESISYGEESDFIKGLKVDVSNLGANGAKRKPIIETPICVGTGLGIQNKLQY